MFFTLTGKNLQTYTKITRHQHRKLIKIGKVFRCHTSLYYSKSPSHNRYNTPLTSSHKYIYNLYQESIKALLFLYLYFRCNENTGHHIIQTHPNRRAQYNFIVALCKHKHKTKAAFYFWKRKKKGKRMEERYSPREEKQFY